MKDGCTKAHIQKKDRNKSIATALRSKNIRVTWAVHYKAAY